MREVELLAAASSEQELEKALVADYGEKKKEEYEKAKLEEETAKIEEEERAKLEKVVAKELEKELLQDEIGNLKKKGLLPPGVGGGDDNLDGELQTSETAAAAVTMAPVGTSPTSTSTTTTASQKQLSTSTSSSTSDNPIEEPIWNFPENVYHYLYCKNYTSKSKCE